MQLLPIANLIMILNTRNTIDMQIFLLEDLVKPFIKFQKKNIDEFLYLFSGDRSAVRLTADHRFHDYINANEVKVTGYF